jgi:hypothetical protein
MYTVLSAPDFDHDGMSSCTMQTVVVPADGGTMTDASSDSAPSDAGMDGGG